MGHLVRSVGLYLVKVLAVAVLALYVNIFGSIVHAQYRVKQPDLHTEIICADRETAFQLAAAFYKSYERGWWLFHIFSGMDAYEAQTYRLRRNTRWTWCWAVAYLPGRSARENLIVQRVIVKSRWEERYFYSLVVKSANPQR